jgi:pantothenate synthetase
VLVAAMAREIGATPLARLDYATVVDDRAFAPPEVLEPGMPARALVAAAFPSARLIDNLRLPAQVAGA